MSGDRERRERWKESRVVAEMWDCGDDYCDCTQPRIYRESPNLEAGYPWVNRDLLWEGTFRTDGEGWGNQDDRDALVVAAEQFGAEMRGEAPPR